MWLGRGKLLQSLGTLKTPSKSPWRLSCVSSFSDSPRKKSKLAPLQERKMIDRFRLCVRGGEGGNGCSSYRRSRHDRRGRPDGGNGGRGGDVILECSPSLWDFSGLQHHVNAGRGGHGASKNKIGSRGADKVVQVPIGTVIHLVEGEIPHAVLSRSARDLDPWEIPGVVDADLLEPDQQPGSTNPNTEGETEAQDNHVGLSLLKGTTGEVSATAKRPARASPVRFFSHAIEGCREDSDLCDEEGSSCESFHTDGFTIEAEEEEEFKGRNDIQYNVAELTEKGQRIMVACGGEGGMGNVSGKVSRKPKHKKNGSNKDSKTVMTDDEDVIPLSAGFPGSEAVLILELKSIADVGLVGMPNAGKSTLLGAISRAQPAVGHYAFTTLRPNIGKLNCDNFFSATVADIPGVIKGAHENRGLGHAFLRHIERTKVLVYVVDLAATLDGQKGLPPWEQLKDLVLELECYREGLSSRPSLVVANKIDEAGAEEVFAELKRRVQGVPIFPVCAVLEEGIPELKAGLKMLVNGEEPSRVSLDCIYVD